MTGPGAPDRPTSDRLAPATADGVREAVAWAVASETPLEIVAGGTKRGWGRPVDANHVLDLSALSGVTLYEPEELVLSARAATPLAEVRALLAEHNQMLAFEPPEIGPLFGQEGLGQPADRQTPDRQTPDRQTLGGVIATNLAGPRRIKAGAARDHFLGFAAVTGRGEAIKSGGRVVKNVTGYDLSKLMAGSFGTLGVMTDVTVKVLPAPEKTRTVLLYGASDTDGIAALADALNSPHDVSAAAHLPAAVAARSGVSYVGRQDKSVSAVRVEGPGPSVEHRCAALRTLWGARGATEELHGHNSAAFWTEVGEVAALLPRGEGALWRISVPPADGAGVAAAIANATDAAVFYDWGGGLIWAVTEASAAAERAVRAAIPAPNRASQGHATLLCAPEALRRSVPVFQPQDAAVAALSERLRAQFDPKGVLNPGRMG